VSDASESPGSVERTSKRTYYARIALETGDGRVRFESRYRHPGARPGRYEATAWPTGEPFDAPTDPLAEFLVERYRFYTEAPDGSVRDTDVDHDTWTLYPAAASVDTGTLLRPMASPARTQSRCTTTVRG
jgi:hypothetical protein